MAAITGAVIAAGTAAYSISSAEKSKKEAKEDAAKFQRQDLRNPFSNIQISTEKANQQTDANLSNFATSVDALQRGGNRAVIAGLPKLSESNVLLQNIISADLDRQAKERDFAIADGEERNKNIRERREEQALSGLGQKLQTARQDSATGVKNLVSGLLAGGSAIANTPSASNEFFELDEVETDIGFQASSSPFASSSTSSIFDFNN